MEARPPHPFVIAALLFVAVMSLYATTVAPDVGLVDSGELVLTAATGGVAHPPGVPLYLLVGRVFSHLPAQNTAHALNLMSAFFVAVAAAFLFLLSERVLAFLRFARGHRTIAAIVGTLAFATSFNPWTWSAVAEVYPLNLALLVASLYFAWRAAGDAEEGDAERGARAGAKADARKKTPAGGAPAWGFIAASALLASLGLANHHATAVLAFPPLLLLVWRTRPSVLRAGRFWGTAFGAIGLALTLYLYLFVAARHDPAMNWGGIDSFETLKRHVIGAQYAQQVGSTWADSVAAAKDFGHTLFWGCGWATALLLGYGVWRLLARALRREKAKAARDLAGRHATVLLVFVTQIGLNLALSMNYIAGPEDRMAYDLPATAAWSLLAAVGAAFVVRAANERAAAAQHAAAIALVLLPVGVNVGRNLELCSLAGERVGRHYAEDTIGRMPEGAVLLTAEWNLYAPYLYLCYEEGWRPDARVIDVLILRRFWYLDYLERAYPEMIEATRAPFERFRAEIRNFDFGRPYDRDNIQRYYDELVFAWIDFGRRNAGAFMDYACFDHPQERGWIQATQWKPNQFLLEAMEPGAELGPEDWAPLEADAAHVAHVRSRLEAGPTPGTFEPRLPRLDPYRKVWRSYQMGTESSLRLALHLDETFAPFDPVTPRAFGSIHAWYPEWRTLPSAQMLLEAWQRRSGATLEGGDSVQ